jgi:hypothetical protein
MRWTARKPGTIELRGEMRVRSWFAFLPVTINSETRWLERVTVEERQEFHVADVCRVMWRKMRFVEPPRDR